MREALRPFPIIAQRIKTHDPRVWPSIHATLIAYDEELFFRMERVDPRKTARRFRRLERKEAQFQKGRLAGEPRPASPAQRALSIEQHVEPLHPAATGTCVCGGSGGG